MSNHFDSTDPAYGREILPDNVKFTHYDLNITPNFKDFTYLCKENIIFYIAQDTNEIILNCKDIVVHSMTIVYDGEMYIPTSILYQPETVHITLPVTLSPKIGVHGTLITEFKGQLNDQLCGFYRTKYTNTLGDECYAGTTQFESHDARRAFMCVDEPGKKATFALILNVPSNFCALSNTPVAKESRCLWNSDFRTVQFEQTPVMSTYLVAWYVGELEYIETMCKLPKTDQELVVRTYTIPGQKEKVQFANDFAAKVICYFSEYYDIDYPLRKLDQLAVPDFAAGAMENWGLVTYRDQFVYVDKSTSQYIKMQVAATIAHELAHQWFGNLVTPEWWNDLWLKEGFATYLEWVAVDHFYPEWKCWEYFVAESFQAALKLDELDSSHPINNNVKLAKDIDGVFDTITYLKGASMLRMLGEWLGEEDFKSGVRTYLKQFQYQNAITNDLWNHLSEASNKNVAEMMDSWINQKGYPLVMVSKNRFNQYLFSQQPYGGEPMDRRFWKIPLHMTWKTSDDLLENIVLEETWSCISIEDGQELIKANTNRTGFYRVLYHPSLDETLRSFIKDKILGTLDRSDIFSGMFDLAQRGYDSTTRSLKMLDCYANESDYIVWSELIQRLNLLKSIWKNHSVVKEFIDQFYKTLLKPHLKKLGWDFTDKDTYQSMKMRQLCISSLAGVGEESILDTCRTCFKDFIQNPDVHSSALNPNIRLSVLVSVIRFSNNGEELKHMKNIFSVVSSTEVKVEILKSLGSTPDSIQLIESLDFVFKSGQVRTQDMFYVLTMLHPTNHYIAWNYITSNWALLIELFSGTGFLQQIICLPLAGLLNTEEMGNTLTFLDKHTEDLATGGGITTAIEQTKESVSKLLEWYKRDEQNVVEWVKSQSQQSTNLPTTTTQQQPASSIDFDDDVFE
jgi:aminopeptidase 2